MACVIEDMKSYIDFLEWVFYVIWVLCLCCWDTLHTLLSSPEIAYGKSSLKYCIRIACQSECLQHEVFFFLSTIKKSFDKISLNIQSQLWDWLLFPPGNPTEIFLHPSYKNNVQIFHFRLATVSHLLQDPYRTFCSSNIPRASMKAIMLVVYAPNCCYACLGGNLSLKYSGLNSVAAVADIVTCVRLVTEQDLGVPH